MIPESNMDVIVGIVFAVVALAIAIVFGNWISRRMG